MITEKQIDHLLRANPPVGHLAERHPEFMFAAVCTIGNEHWVIPTWGDPVVAPPGLRVRKFSGGEFIT